MRMPRLLQTHACVFCLLRCEPSSFEVFQTGDYNSSQQTVGETSQPENVCILRSTAARACTKSVGTRKSDIRIDANKLLKVSVMS